MIKKCVWLSGLFMLAAAACGGESLSFPDGSAHPIVDAGRGSVDATAPSADAGDDTGDSPGKADGLILFGGADRERAVGTEWLWDGERWQQQTATGPAPEARMDHAMAYDPVRQRVVLFGGQTGGDSGFFDDTWEWDGERWQNVEADPPEDLAARSGHGLVYHAGIDEILMFGGHAGGTFGLGRREDTWLWDGSRWEEVITGDISSRTRFGMAYHAADGEVVVFSGNESCCINPRPSDTWIRDETQWSEIDTGDTQPEGRRGHAMAYDPVRERVVLFGGQDGSDLMGDTWEWDDEGWREIEPTGGVAPTARQWHALAFDPATERVVLFGGDDGGELFSNETWAWDGQAWERLEDAGGPSVGLVNAAMARRPPP